MAAQVSTKPSVKFVDAPPAQGKGSGGQMAAKYGDVLAALRENVGSWAEIATGITPDNRGDVDKIRGYFRSNGAETQTVRTGPSKAEYRWSVYARIVASA